MNKANQNKRSIRKMVGGMCLVAAIANAVLMGPSPAQAQSSQPITGQQITAPIKFGKLERYTHPSQLFTMQIPNNWEQNDLSTYERAILSIGDPTGNAGLVAAVYGGEAELSKDEMGQKLAEYIDSAFSNFTQFKANEPKALQSFNGAGLGFSYRQKLSNNKTVTMYGDAFYQQYDKGVVGIFVLLLPKEQYESAKVKMYDLLDGIQVQPEYYEGTPTNVETGVNVVVGDLTDYSDDSGSFFLRVPAAWAQNAGNSNGLDYISWTDESGLATLSLVKSQVKSAGNTSALKTAAQEFIDGYAQNSPTLSNLETVGSTTLDKNAVLAKFTYTAELESGTVPMSASVLVRQSGKQTLFMLLTLPTNSTDPNADAIDEMIHSVEIWN